MSTTAYYITKVAVTAVLIVVVSEIAKRSSLFGAILASIPLVSVLALMWLYVDTGDLQKIRSLSIGIFWLVLPSLVLFIVLPALLKLGVSFWPSLSLAVAATVLAYVAMVAVLRQFGVAA